MAQVAKLTVPNQDLESTIIAMAEYGYNEDDGAVTIEEGDFYTTIRVECITEEDYDLVMEGLRF